MSDRLNRDKLEAAVNLGLVNWCPECEGTGQPTPVSNPDGTPWGSLECDCSGYGVWVPEESSELFRKVMALVNAADEAMPIEGTVFPNGWAHLGVMNLVEKLASGSGVQDGR